MKRSSLSAILFCILLLALTGPASARMTRVKEVRIEPRVSVIELSSFLGSITWVPITSQEEARVTIEVVADGVSQMSVRNALLQVRIVENVKTSSILLEARRPALPAGVDYVKVNYVVYAPPGQFRQLKAQTANGPIEILSPFNAQLTLINQNAPIILHSGRGGVHLLTDQAPIELGELDLVLSSQVQTSQGAISGKVSFPAQGSFYFKTSQAPIEIKVPTNTSGTFKLSSTSGAVDFRLGDDVYTGLAEVIVERGSEPVFDFITTNSTITVHETF